ncbi:MAG: DUF2062 domain-containing protein [Pseudomonadales bacterium]|nr:DUF2062 domain-containing protein [Pseudomonadales bacterium]
MALANGSRHNTALLDTTCAPLRKYLPTKDQLREVRSLRFLGEMIFEPNLWHFNRHSVSYAFLIGTFCCFLPIPFQMVPCVLFAVWIRCNIPLAIALVWVSNPITMPPMFYATYKLGTWILGERNEVSRINLSWEWLSAQFAVVWQPLLLGSVLTGLTLGSLGFVAVRLYWRYKVSKNWSMRRLRKSLAHTIHSEAPQPAAGATHDKTDTTSRED